jgi:hypothetical protein
MAQVDDDGPRRIHEIPVAGAELRWDVARGLMQDLTSRSARRAGRSRAGWILGLSVVLLGAGCAPAQPDSSPAASNADVRASASAAAPASGAPSNGPAPSPFVPSGDLSPDDLARAILTPATPDAGRDAILSVFAGAGIGVYTSGGDPVVVGAERSSADFFAYDFEIDGLAAAAAAGERTRLTDIADDLSAAGIDDGGRPFTVDELAAAMQRAAAGAVQQPDGAGMYAIRMIRALVMAGPAGTDIAGSFDATALELDPLSSFLLAADLTLPTLDAGPSPVALTGQLAAAGRAPAIRLAVSGACQSLGNLAGAHHRSVGAVAQDIIGNGLRPDMDVSPYLQAVLMHSTVEAKLDGSEHWHWFHADTGNTGIVPFILTLRLRVRSTPQAIDCGLLTGVTLPPEGPLKEAPVTWDDSRLLRHGTDDCSSGCRETDSSGQATLEHTQNTEPGPGGVGPEQTETVTVRASVNLAQALGTDLAMLVQSPLVVRAEKQSQVSWHRAYKVTLDMDSVLVQHKAPNYEGKVATAAAQGTFDVSNARAHGGRSIDDAVAGSLTVRTQPGPGEGTCNTVTARGHGTIDWMIREAIVWPPEDIAVHMDTGTDTENVLPDKYWIHLCVLNKTVLNEKSKGSVWESMFSLGHIFGPLGFAFIGLAANDGWSVLATDDTWRRGGLVAIWEGEERCGGYCSAGHVQLKLSVTPLPGP